MASRKAVFITNLDLVPADERKRIQDRIRCRRQRERRQVRARGWRSELAHRWRAGDPDAARALRRWGIRRAGMRANEATGWANLVKARAVLAQKRAEGKALDERDRLLRQAGIEPPERAPTPYARRQARIRRIKEAQFPEALTAHDRAILAQRL